jgi:hypothetical protein
MTQRPFVRSMWRPCSIVGFVSISATFPSADHRLQHPTAR